jgi:hypothetical protein
MNELSERVIHKWYIIPTKRGSVENQLCQLSLATGHWFSLSFTQQLAHPFSKEYYQNLPKTYPDVEIGKSLLVGIATGFHY